jgi:hypothetical protein
MRGTKSTSLLGISSPSKWVADSPLRMFKSWERTQTCPSTVTRNFLIAGLPYDFRTENCLINYGIGGSFFKFDIGRYTSLTAPPTLTINVKILSKPSIERVVLEFPVRIQQLHRVE